MRVLLDIFIVALLINIPSDASTACIGLQHPMLEVHVPLTTCQNGLGIRYVQSLSDRPILPYLAVHMKRDHSIGIFLWHVADELFAFPVEAKSCIFTAVPTLPKAQALGQQSTGLEYHLLSVPLDGSILSIGLVLPVPLSA